MSKLTNKRVVITGGSSGIGQAIVYACAKEGAYTVFSYNRNEKGALQTQEFASSLGSPKIYALQADLAEISAVKLFFEKSIQLMGGIDILINNAGTLTRYPHFLEIPIDNFEYIQAVNMRAPFILTQLAAKQMQKQNSGGSIINISSMSADIISRGLTHYECSKAGVHALTRSTANALASSNIRVNAIAPGLIATEMNRNQRESEPNIWSERSSKIPLGRAGHPQDIANVAIFLASDESQWITGTIIPVDGGVGVSSVFG